MKIGGKIYTPRFCTVRIDEIFKNYAEAVQHGYGQPTYYRKGGYSIIGKCIEDNCMVFAEYKEV